MNLNNYAIIFNPFYSCACPVFPHRTLIFSTFFSLLTLPFSSSSSTASSLLSSTPSPSSRLHPCGIISSSPCFHDTNAPCLLPPLDSLDFSFLSGRRPAEMEVKGWSPGFMRYLRQISLTPTSSSQLINCNTHLQRSEGQFRAFRCPGCAVVGWFDSERIELQFGVGM